MIRLKEEDSDMLVIQIQAMMTPGRWHSVWAPIGPFTSDQEVDTWLTQRGFDWDHGELLATVQGTPRKAVVLELRSPTGPVDG